MASRWTASQKNYLIAQAGRAEPGIIGLAINKSERAVTSFARKHGISLAIVRRRWSDEDDAVIAGAVSMGETAKNIAVMLNRTEKAVSGRIDALRRKGSKRG